MQDRIKLPLHPDTCSIDGWSVDEQRVLREYAQAIARECISALKTVKGESSECSDGERRYFEADTSDYVDAIRARFGIAEE